MPPKKKQLVDIDCENCGGQQTALEVGSVTMSPEEPLHYCPGCKTWHIDHEQMVGDPNGFKQRMQDIYKSGRVTIFTRGRKMGLGKFAGAF